MKLPRFGEKNALVGELQDFLNANGATPKLVKDNHFGTKTMDALTEYLLPTPAPKTADPVKPAFGRKCKTRTEASNYFGSIVGTTWRDEAKHMSMLAIPSRLGKDWINSISGKPVTRIYCNKAMQPSLMYALMLLETRGLLEELKTFDGCFQIRKVRGGTGMSTHSYGLAVDVNAAENGLGATPKLSKEFVACFKEAGFAWGGDFKRKDGMHFSYAWEG